MRWYAVLFWIWVVVSLGIFLWRRLYGASRSDVATPEGEHPAPATRQWAPPPREPGAAAPTATTGRPEDDEGPTAAAPPRSAGTPHASAPTPSGASTSPPSGDEQATLADLLAGITLPHGLVPLTQSGPSVDLASEIVVATDTATPEQVRTGLTQEIEKLGYRVTPSGEYRALAEGARGVVELEIHPHAGSLAAEGSPRFPTATPGTVVVELRAVRGTPG